MEISSGVQVLKEMAVGMGQVCICTIAMIMV